MNYLCKLVLESVKWFPLLFLVCFTTICVPTVFREWGWIGLGKMAVVYIALFLIPAIFCIIFDCTMWIIDK